MKYIRYAIGIPIFVIGVSMWILPESFFDGYTGLDLLRSIFISLVFMGGGLWFLDITNES